MAPSSPPDPSRVPGEEALESASSDEPIPKKRKRKKAREGARTTSTERAPRDVRGNDRPRFLLSFPKDPELETLMHAFESGDYARVREQAPRLVERSDRPEVRRAAEELLIRIEPDPLLKFLLWVAIGLFLSMVTFVYYAHG